MRGTDAALSLLAAMQAPEMQIIKRLQLEGVHTSMWYGMPCARAPQAPLQEAGGSVGAAGRRAWVENPSSHLRAAGVPAAARATSNGRNAIAPHHCTWR